MLRSVIAVSMAVGDPAYASSSALRAGPVRRMI
jgi:hypothetical protein